MDLLESSRIMRVGDRLSYQIVEEREPFQRLFVDSEGMVDVPLIGRQKAAGLSPQAFAYQLKQELEKDFFHQATVLVAFDAADGTRGEVKVVGMVVRPGPMPIMADEVLTASLALTRSGGARPGAALDKAVILRVDPTNPESQERITVDLRAVLEQGDVAADRVLLPDDTLVLPESANLRGTFLITGEVGAEGVYTLPVDGTRMMVSEAVMRAGGFSKFANKRRVILMRADPSLPEAQRRVIVDVQRVLEDGDRSGDVPVGPDDVIRVTDRKFVW